MMNRIATAPLSFRLSLPRIRCPKLDIGATIIAVSTGIAQAHCMAYVEPFNAMRRPSSVPSDVDLEGRDPNW